MKYPFKFTHFSYDNIIYTADKNDAYTTKVSWCDDSGAPHSTIYGLIATEKYIADGTWKVIEEEAKMKPITENIKIKVNPEQSAIVQEICFKNGIDWSEHCLDLGPAKSVKFADKPALLIDAIGRYNDGKCLYWQTLSEYNAECHTKEYTFEQFVQEFGEQPVKETKPRKHSELIKAWADGAEIQYKVKANGNWTDISIPSWDDVNEYRIKPAEPVDPLARVVIYVSTVNTNSILSKTFNMKLSEIEEFINKHPEA